MIFLAFDYGEKRIGAAVGDDVTGSARPLPVLASGEWKSIERVIAEWRPAEIIVGLPLDDSGAEQPMTVAARRFAA
ncbi:MAG TPA: Holliday junction resolvase RuvX, partial [Nevskiaceae bacterium]|nr:Holliday junction resolvase RuvX [Nevskiaceae bacterium]